jgi:hypothetical protein
MPILQTINALYMSEGNVLGETHAEGPQDATRRTLGSGSHPRDVYYHFPQFCSSSENTSTKDSVFQIVSSTPPTAAVALLKLLT